MLRAFFVFPGVFVGWALAGVLVRADLLVFAVRGCRVGWVGWAVPFEREVRAERFVASGVLVVGLIAAQDVSDVLLP